MEFTCESCSYKTNIKCNYGKHLKSTKHEFMLQKINSMRPKDKPIESIDIHEKSNTKSSETQPTVIQNTTNPYSCKYCEQAFKFKQSMYRHIKYRCTKNKDNKDEDLKELVRIMKLQLQHKDKQIETQAKQIEKLMDKIKINGSFNNNTINHYTLLVNEGEISTMSQSELMSYVSNKLLNQSQKL